jgi:hypothetical protein
MAAGPGPAAGLVARVLLRALLLLALCHFAADPVWRPVGLRLLLLTLLGVPCLLQCNSTSSAVDYPKMIRVSAH